jgi:hypothetical protein
MKTIINLIIIKRVDKSNHKKFLLSKTRRVLRILSNFSSVQKLEKDSKKFYLRKKKKSSLFKA